MPYQGLLLAGVLGFAVAVALTLLLANDQQEEQQQVYGHANRRGGAEDYLDRRRGNKTYEQDICVICHDSMLDARRPLRTLGCNHKYHQECINRWFRIQDRFCLSQETLRCPICRSRP